MGGNASLSTLWRYIVNIRTIAVAAVTGLAALTLAACSGDETPEEPTSPEPVVEAPVEEETPEAPEESPEPEEEPEAPVGDGSEAAPGASFAYGETARVNWDSHHSDDGVLLDVTVEGVREGDLEDLLALGLRDETAAALEGHSVHYVDYSITKVDQSQPEIAFGNASGAVSAMNAGGSELQEFTLLGGSFDACESNTFKADIDTGGVLTSCSIFIIPGGQEFGSVVWTQFDTPYDKYDGEPISWQ